jgi:hypothetical protein
MSAGVVCQGLVSGGLRFASDFDACLFILISDWYTRRLPQKTDYKVFTRKC